MATIRFTTQLLQAKQTATGIEVPTEMVEKLGAGKKPKVKVTINGYAYRSSIAVMHGLFMVGVSADVRSKTGIKGGDTIEVFIELDIEERILDIPEDFQKMLEQNEKVHSFFQTLSYSNKQRYLLPIGQAKTKETRQRRMEKTIVELVQNTKK